MKGNRGRFSDTNIFRKIYINPKIGYLEGDRASPSFGLNLS